MKTSVVSNTLMGVGALIFLRSLVLYNGVVFVAGLIVFTAGGFYGRNGVNARAL